MRDAIRRHQTQSDAIRIEFEEASADDGCNQTSSEAIRRNQDRIQSDQASPHGAGTRVRGDAAEQRGERHEQRLEQEAVLPEQGERGGRVVEAHQQGVEVEGRDGAEHARGGDGARA